jgi:signal transduction histidine kinase
LGARPPGPPGRGPAPRPAPSGSTARRTVRTPRGVAALRRAGDEIGCRLAYGAGMEPPAEHLPPRRRGPILAGPLVLAVFQVAGTLGATKAQSDRRPLDALAVVLVLAGPAALLWMRRFTVPALWAVAGVTLAYLLRGYAYGPVVFSLAVAVVIAVVRGHRTAAWLSVGLVYFGHLTGLVLGDAGWSWGRVLGVGAWALVILAVAEVARVRTERAGAARQARAETVRRQANEERLRIARELHDVVAHHMSLINVQAGVALHLVDRRPEQAQTALVAIKDASKEALVELRALVGVLRDEAEAAPRAPASKLGSLDGLVERSSHAGLTVRKLVQGEERPLSASVELAAFRIVQEAITNVVRHSGARQADICLDYGARVLTVEVADDGTGGARIASLGEGSGIRGMRERSAALRGTLTLAASPRGGLRLVATLPLGGDRLGEEPPDGGPPDGDR